MKIPYGRHNISNLDIDAVVEVLKSDWLTTGPYVTKFESLIAEVSGSKFATAVTSGTAALHTAYAAMGVGAGDEVITSPMTFSATATTAIQLGAAVKFADVDYATGLIDVDQIGTMVNQSTKVVTAVDYAGNPSPIDKIRQSLKSDMILILQDAAHSIGGFYGGQPIGSIADVTAFSFFPTKNLTTGEGGAVVTNSPEIFRAAQLFKGQGIERDISCIKSDEGPWFYEVQQMGLNYRLPDILCALGISQISRLSEFKSRRNQLRNQYISAFKEHAGIRLIENVAGSDPMWHLFPIFVDPKRRKEIYEKLHRENISVQVNYIPVYWHPFFQQMGYKIGMCPKSEKFYSEEISLPLYYGLTDSQQNKIIELLLKILAE